VASEVELSVEFRVLGRVEAWVDDHKVDLGPAESAKARCVLVVLLRSPGSLVSADALSYRVWDDPPPGPATRYKYVGWLRSALSPYGVALTSTPEGYVLHVKPDQVDLHRFRRLVTEAHESLRTGTASRAATLLDEALQLWRGPALAGLSGSWAALFRDQLEGERKAASVLRAYADLERGRAGELIAELAEWECENPTDEVITGLRMLALYRCGRRDEALTCYRRAQGRIRSAFDADPGPELQKLARHIQAGDPVPPTGALGADGPRGHGRTRGDRGDFGARRHRRNR
jgi:DNA-binding SARP family transcriptional activator